MTKEEKTSFLGCLGAVLASIITGIVTIMVSAPHLVPFLQTPTPIPTPLPTPTVDFSSWNSSTEITNHLYNPVDIYINEVYQGRMKAMETRTFLIPNFPSAIRSVMDRTIGDQSWGEPMEGTFYQVVNGSHLDIKNVIGDTIYFRPVFNNNTNTACNITINKDLLHGNIYPGSIPPNTNNITCGYYVFYLNTNVSLNCGGQEYRFGPLPDGIDNFTLYDYLEPNTGSITFTVP